MKRKVIAIGNQKGGVGKTTTTLNIGVALSKLGYKVLLVDLDQQGNLSKYLGYQDSDDDVTIFNLIKESMNASELSLDKAIHQNNDENIDYIPADMQLSGAEMLLFTAMSREHVLRRIFEYEFFDRYDYILIDCLPGIGILFINAIAAADGLVIPVQTQKFAMDGLNLILNVFEDVKRILNKKLELYGILPTIVDRTVISREAVKTLKKNFNGTVFETQISKRVEAPESTFTMRSLVNTKNSFVGAEYIAVTNELLHRIKEA